MNHCLECLIYRLNRNKNLRVNGEVKLSKNRKIVISAEVSAECVS